MLNIYLIGDSTVANCPAYEYPMAGWGQYFDQYFDQTKVSVINRAKGGASSNSFIEEGRLKQILNELKPNDYALIQFGHNDQKEYGSQTPERYRKYLTYYLDQISKWQAHPILVSPVHRRFFTSEGKVNNTLGEFPDVVRELAQQQSIPFVDLSKRTKELYEAYGVEQSKQLFTWLAPNEHANYPEGIKDNTHFSEKGARLVGELVCQEIKRLNLPLKAYIRSN
ncbi:rhamnogalacturonan acetylesterase [Amphibacillus sediminis]|uniref:rhamnogalacturonan acetylesterase n=1 Tax=Amphibacillus sediminis TaxID=360185 RepID=UPI000835E883|nr:rhamnogalacturonan acetylesterase [Amphibacillus sediminis]